MHEYSAVRQRTPVSCTHYIKGTFDKLCRLFLRKFVLVCLLYNWTAEFTRSAFFYFSAKFVTDVPSFVAVFYSGPLRIYYDLYEFVAVADEPFTAYFDDAFTCEGEFGNRSQVTDTLWSDQVSRRVIRD